ncbi:GNAT superfamily N-acetyltransferase [Pullulanibacillus pueri]|uniref:Putative N-acetyltransferase YhdJ n=1 Tax=Pullulanibacillus pueri TaxID=1437324 RepID=A0A8J2ZVG3_9BACL|nr:GNAT family N-acetyltransferase [Pullulanibacillus pueri]MBM7680910.1 GNAT superfamily N-acetyltransferase [Pullulanibacillus pueri]GGH81298.1 putative N-acetyltransferase YhdJ [Pullulanibacillus pueri]
MDIKELRHEEEWKDAYPVMHQLRTQLDLENYLRMVREASEFEGYKLFALYDQSKIVAVTGFMPMMTLSNGKYIWVCDLVTDSEVRSKGYGQKLLGFVEAWSKERGYGIVSLSSGVQRHDAHRFYEEKMKFDRVSHVFLKQL